LQFSGIGPVDASTRLLKLATRTAPAASARPAINLSRMSVPPKLNSILHAGAAFASLPIQESSRMRHIQACFAVLFLSALILSVAGQSVYPIGTTFYDPNRAWNGYTVLSPLNTQAAIVIDMNGNVVKRWD